MYAGENFFDEFVHSFLSSVVWVGVCSRMCLMVFLLNEPNSSVAVDFEYAPYCL